MRLTITLLVTLMSCLGAAESHATELFWSEASGGFFNVPANCSPLGTPGIGDDAIFNLDATFAIDFNTPQATDGLDVLDGDVTFSPISAVTYTTSETSLINNGELLRLTGNGANTFLLDSVGLVVGLNGDGDLTLEDGSSVISEGGSVAMAVFATKRVTLPTATSALSR